MKHNPNGVHSETTGSHLLNHNDSLLANALDDAVEQVAGRIDLNRMNGDETTFSLTDQSAWNRQSMRGAQ